MDRALRLALLGAVFLASAGVSVAAARTASPPSLQNVVDRAVRPVMREDGIPGMAVAVTAGGRQYEFDYGVASKSGNDPVTPRTLFEIGSISKTFTATLAAIAQIQGRLSLSQTTATYLPSLRGTAFGDVTLLELGTHTPGGLPLQVPDGVTDEEQLIEYLRAWRPPYAPGTMRTYNNPGIGTLGLIAARTMGKDFAALMDAQIFRQLGMGDTFIDLPQDAMARYAWGYTDRGTPVRMTRAMLWQETYGVRTSASDLLRFVRANMGELATNDTLQHAIAATHVGYYRAGPMVQDLIWEQYALPVSQATLLAGNSYKMLLTPVPAHAIEPPLRPQRDALLDKTGSTNGFGAYVAYVPSKRIGVVILANKNYAIPDRVRLAYALLQQLASQGGTSLH